jgi:diadenosine tetraphosphate (Ap4A) HIT family hydrolase
MAASSTTFTLDPRLAVDTLPIAQLGLCEVRLMDDTRFGWLVLIPRRTALEEIFDLEANARAQLLAELDRAAVALRAELPCDKLNVGVLGNIVRQLHVHVVARRTDDAAWPGAVWGHGARVSYTPAAGRALCAALRLRLRPATSTE